MTKPKQKSIYEKMRPQAAYEPVIRQRKLDGISFGRKYRKQLVRSNCPACGHEGTKAFEKYGFGHMKCPVCQTLFVSPRPGEKLLDIFYNNYKAPRMWTKLLLQADAERKAVQYTPRVNRIVAIMKEREGGKDRTALDLGAGSGAFAICLKRTKYFKNIVALDLSSDCTAVCSKLGFDTILGSITDVPPNSVDLITMNDLIEHVFDPAKLLRDCARALRPKGYVSIATPNGEGFDFKILGKDTGNITPPEHLNYFNTGSIARLLNRTGFEPVYVETPGKLDVDIILKRRNAGFPLKTRNQYLDYLLNRGESIRSGLQDFLSLNGLSSHMLVLARKK